MLAEIETTLAALEGAGWEVAVESSDPIGFDPGMVARVLAPNLVARARELSSSQQALLEEPFRSLVTGDGYRPTLCRFRRSISLGRGSTTGSSTYWTTPTSSSRRRCSPNRL